MAVGRCVLHLVAVPQLITSHHENCFASWKWVNNSIIKNENSSSVASWLHKSLECWNRSESARLQGISEGKSTINRRLDGNEMIMMPSAFGKECTNVLLALKGCCILERCVCRLKMWLRYLPQDKLVPVPYIAFWEFRVTLRVLCLTLRYACAICFWCGVATILF